MNSSVSSLSNEIKDKLTTKNNSIDVEYQKRVVDLFEKIEVIRLNKNIELLSKICRIAMPIKNLDNEKKLFQFNLFSLTPIMLNQLEEIVKNVK